MGEQAWTYFTTSTVDTSEELRLPWRDLESSKSPGLGDWHFGYVKDRESDGAPAAKTSTYLHIENSPAAAGRWGGYYGTIYTFDATTGIYFCGGENTLNVVDTEHGGTAAKNGCNNSGVTWPQIKYFVPYLPS